MARRLVEKVSCWIDGVQQNQGYGLEKPEDWDEYLDQWKDGHWDPSSHREPHVQYTTVQEWEEYEEEQDSSPEQTPTEETSANHEQSVSSDE